MKCGKRLNLLTGNANPALAQEVAEGLGIPLCEANVGRFNNGEIQVMIDESVRGSDVFIIQPLAYPVNDNLMELLIMTDAAKRASARNITAVIPYYAYARQDRKTRGREPISAKLIADLLQTAGVTRVVTMDLHAGQIQGFFNIPVDNLVGVPTLAEYVRAKQLNDLVVVSPDLGGVTRARRLADLLHAQIAIIEKRRPQPGVAEVMNIIGNIDGKNAVIIDDIVDTAGSLTEGAKALAGRGAKSVYACCTHPVLSPPAVERVQNSFLTELIVTNTIPVPTEKCSSKIRVLSVAGLLGEVITRIYGDQSVSTLFD